MPVETCGRCSGDGWIYEGPYGSRRKVDCPVCGGNGRVTASSSSPCARCSGDGWLYEGPFGSRRKALCSVCGGTGFS